jgi:hypothetical protein
MDLPYGTSAFSRDRGDFPALPVVNLFAEQVATENQLVLQSRPGLNLSMTIGTGPIRDLFQIDGVLNNQLFAVSGTHLYKGATDVGSIDGSGPVSMAGYENFLFVTGGASLWGYDGTTFASISTSGGFQVLDLCVGGSRVIVIDKGTGKIYWSDALVTILDPLNFATAENSPDKLKACLFQGDTLLLFGSETVEFWPISGDASVPFQPLVGRTFAVGIRDTGCATLFDGLFAWITNHNKICISDPDGVVSSPGLEEKLAASTSASLWTFWLEGTEFLAVRMDAETWVFSARTKTWSQFESYGQGNFLPQCYVGGYFGSSVDGQLYHWTDDYSDFGDVLERRFRAGAPATTGALRCDNITLRCNVGYTPFMSGTYANPTVEMKTSRSGGQEWSAYKPKSLGATGEYQKVVQWRGLGFFGFPGLLIDFRVTDPVPFRVSGVKMNEPYGAA